MERRTHFVGWAMTTFLRCATVLLVCATWLWAPSVQAQSTTQYSNTTTGTITDNNCGTAGQITRTFVVPISYIVADVDLGVLLSHTYRSDLRITLTSPVGTSVTVMTWSGNVQSGDNLNDRFDDEAAAAITTHNATANDSTTATLPNFAHQYRPSNPLSVFDGQNALGTWTMVLCDAVANDVGTFARADLFITSTRLTATKSNTLISDPINGTTNPKYMPGAVVRYCVLVTNEGGISHNNVSLADPLPTTLTFVPGSMRSGTNCNAATIEDDNTTGADESDLIGMSFTGTTISGAQATLTAGSTIAFVFDVTVN